MLTSFYNFSSSTFLLICYRLFSSIGSKIFLSIFLSKVICVCSADLYMNHVAAQYVATGHTAILHNLHIVILDIFLDFTTLIKLKLNLLPNTTQCLISLFITLLYGIAYIYENLPKLTIKHRPKFVAHLNRMYYRIGSFTLTQLQALRQRFNLVSLKRTSVFSVVLVSISTQTSVQWPCRYC